MRPSPPEESSPENPGGNTSLEEEAQAGDYVPPECKRYVLSMFLVLNVFAPMVIGSMMFAGSVFGLSSLYYRWKLKSMDPRIWTQKSEEYELGDDGQFLDRTVDYEDDLKQFENYRNRNILAKKQNED
jgi:hypothetical protein